ncbi:hypothetical protein EDB86DRAFT_781125 [Lactarius hatsudake]|nr:hypothetical protein EDB86DRAFT_781125 [Lactarius hatsudake]
MLPDHYGVILSGQGAILGLTCSSSLRTLLTEMGRAQYTTCRIESRLRCFRGGSKELENYVPPEVVKVVVGNKLDKRAFPPGQTGTNQQQRARCSPSAWSRCSSAVGMAETFSNVVAHIIDTPEAQSCGGGGEA